MSSFLKLRYSDNNANLGLGLPKRHQNFRLKKYKNGGRIPQDSNYPNV